MNSMIYGRDVTTLAFGYELADLLNQWGFVPRDDSFLKQSDNFWFGKDSDHDYRMAIHNSRYWIHAWYYPEETEWIGLGVVYDPPEVKEFKRLGKIVNDRTWVAAASEDAEMYENVGTIHDVLRMAEFEGGGVRASDEGKPRFDLLWPKGVPYKEQPLYKLAMHLTEGAKKYEDRNWEKFHDQESLDRAMQSKMRHHAQDVAGETDEPHNIAEMANCLFVETIRWKVENGWTPDDEQ